MTPEAAADLATAHEHLHEARLIASLPTGPDRIVTDQNAAAMIEDATRFVARVAELLAQPSSKA